MSTAFPAVRRLFKRTNLPIHCCICGKQDVPERKAKINNHHITGHHFIPKYVKRVYPDMAKEYGMIMPVCYHCHKKIEENIKTRLPNFHEATATFDPVPTYSEILEVLQNGILELNPTHLLSNQITKLGKI